MVNDIHSFAALHCRTGKKEAGTKAGRSTGLMKGRLEKRRMHLSLHLFAPNLQNHLHSQHPTHHQHTSVHAASSPRHRRRHRLQQLAFNTSSLSNCSLSKSLCLTMSACSILRKSWSLPIQNSHVDDPCFRCNMHSSKKHSTDVQLLQSSEGVCECMILVL